MWVVAVVVVVAVVDSLIIHFDHANHKAQLFDTLTHTNFTKTALI